MMFLLMSIYSVVVDPLTKTPVVILKEVEGKRILPVWIGMLEATSIAGELEGVKYPRPMTHDLLTNILELIGVTVSRVEVYDLKDNTYFAYIHIIHKDKEISIDARPSDALSLALRVDAPIFVAEKVIQQSKQIYLEAEAEDKSEEGKKWQGILEGYDPDDFGNT